VLARQGTDAAKRSAHTHHPSSTITITITTITITITTITTIVSSAGYLQGKPDTSRCAFHRSSGIDMLYLAVWLWWIHGRIV
jgi:hypothetical protein